MTRAKFHEMTAGTREDWQAIARCAIDHNRTLPERILDHLRLLGADHGGFAVSRLEHCLQTASRAQRDGRDDEYVVCALLHDIGDTLGSYNHADLAAAILRPFVSEEHLFMVEKHGVFQGLLRLRAPRARIDMMAAAGTVGRVGRCQADTKCASIL